MPSSHEPRARTLISLMVTQWRTSSPSVSTTTPTQAAETLGSVGPQPEVLAQPGRVGEVVEGDERRQLALEAGVDDGRVADERLLVRRAVLGEDPRPLDAEAEAVAPQPGGAVERLFGALPEAHTDPRGLDPPDLLPRLPVVGRLAGSVVAALDLESGGAHAEGEAGRQQARLGFRRRCVTECSALARHRSFPPSRSTPTSARRPSRWMPELHLLRFLRGPLPPWSAGTDGSLPARRDHPLPTRDGDPRRLRPNSRRRCVGPVTRAGRARHSPRPHGPGRRGGVGRGTRPPGRRRACLGGERPRARGSVPGLRAGRPAGDERPRSARSRPSAATRPSGWSTGRLRPSPPAICRPLSSSVPRRCARRGPDGLPGSERERAPEPDRPADPVVGDDRPGLGPAEFGIGLMLPVHIYPMLESVIAARAGRDAHAHRQAMGALLAPFTEVAARHPYRLVPGTT